MDEKELKEELAKVEKRQKEIQDAVDSSASKEELKTLQGTLDDLKKQIEGLSEKAESKELKEQLKKFEEIAKTQGEEITKLSEHLNTTTTKQEATNLADAIIKQIRENKDNIVKHVKDGKGMMSIEMKAAGDMTITGNFPTGNVALSMLEPGMTRIQRRAPFMRQIMNVGSTTTKFVVWVEQANPDPGVAGMTGEGLAKTQTDFDLVERNSPTKKITAYIKVSQEMLEDIDFIEAEIRSELIELIELQLDSQLFSGDGTGNNMIGVNLNAIAFNGGGLTGTVLEANNFDVIRAVVNQIVTANFMPNWFLVNPTDAAAMDLTKANDGHYVMPPFTTADGTTVAGIRIIENNGVPVGDFLCGDFTKANLRIRRDMRLEIGRDQDDFTKNFFTILAEMRAVSYVKTNHFNAFVKGDFDTAKAAILAAPVV